MRNAMNSKRSPRSRVIAACLVVALAAPAAATAMPQQSAPAAAVAASPFPLAPVHRDIPGTAPTAPTASAPSAVRVVRSVTVTNANTTLPIVLAAIALAIALTGAAYVTLRLRPVARS